MRIDKVKLIWAFLSGIYFCSTSVFAQITTEQYVVSSAGMEFSAGGISTSSTLGETVIATFSGAEISLTQGFHQPSLLSASNMALSLAKTQLEKASCPFALDGKIKIAPLNGVGPYTYQWIPEVSTSDSAYNLQAGEYVVTATDALGRTGTSVITIDYALEECEVKFYNGFTPNDDGKNDQWNIGDIYLFPDNDIRIFNRWGSLVWIGKNYDNQRIVFTGKGMRGDILPEGTYFFMGSIGKTKYKGWIELTR